MPPDYDTPLAYVRHHKPSHQELRDTLEYVIDAEDEAWLHNNSKFGGSIPTREKDVDTEEKKSDEETMKMAADAPRTIPLPLSFMEIMMDIMEKVTGFEIIITLDQAEHLIVHKLPQLLHMYPRKGKAQVVTLRQVLYDIYQYWVSKRSKLKRPLLRRFWPVTSTDDTNPHLVFRPREKEKYKLRKKRQNDMDAYRKMQQLKQDFAQVRLLLLLVKQREELNRSLVLLQKEWFEQKLYDAVDTSGLARISRDLDRQSLNELMQVEKHFEIQEAGAAGWRGRTKRGRRGNSQAGSRTASRSTTPVAHERGGMFGSASSLLRGAAAAGLGAETTKMPVVVAGHNNGEPAPNFLQPLPTRESYATSWAGTAPYITTIVDGRPMPTFRFRHRPRVGRGGRICIDRIPMETDPNVAPNTYYRAAAAPSVALEPKERLLDLLPPQINKDILSRRIEEICLTALKEEYDAAEASSHSAGLADAEENEATEVVVPVNDWLETDDQLWGEERYAVGPL